MRRCLGLLALWVAVCQAQVRRPVLVISVDGLDHRYLRDADQLGLKIPNLRRIIGEGEWADGVRGVLPTVTWPSHTTLITGVTPERHGILGNRRPASEGGDYYWTADLLKVKTLWHATRAAGLKSAAITWPVTVGADIDYNLPEFFRKRNGGGMDLASIEEKATPGLSDEIAKMFPAYPHQWMDDRSRTLATIFLLKVKRPDLILLHLVDHDAEAHERGPFSRDAKGILEYTDELIGEILRAMPRQYVLALVSDHGFERIDRVVNLGAALQGNFTITPSLLIAEDEAAAAMLRQAAKRAELGIGREIPKSELAQFSPRFAQAAAVFEPAAHTLFGTGKDRLITTPGEIGVHGLWPGRADYRSVFALWGQGIAKKRLPEMDMTAIAGRLAAILGVKLD
ncbi:MAG: ectonucleotide pyrophosphatase/phosphodiesterase [Bryobacteraceae bacterium]|nr:ectonucleotide pyrophosphatase/phosphodiesterase [Bryobacteraceae bacterium]MDW8377856.1 ectonucleotide pyrophosphatase/phosphodiesterase [Bryobacterales bacterium]